MAATATSWPEFGRSRRRGVASGSGRRRARTRASSARRRGRGRPGSGAGGGAAGRAPAVEPATRTSTSRAWSTTHVTSPRVVSKRPRASSSSICRVRVDGAVEGRHPVARHRRLLEALRGGQGAHPLGQSLGHRSAAPGHRRHRGADGVVVGATLGDSRHTGRRPRPSGPPRTASPPATGRGCDRAGPSSAAAARRPAAPRRPASPSFATATAPGGCRCAPASRTTASRGQAESTSRRT